MNKTNITKRIVTGVMALALATSTMVVPCVQAQSWTSAGSKITLTSTDNGASIIASVKNTTNLTYTNRATIVTTKADGSTVQKTTGKVSTSPSSSIATTQSRMANAKSYVTHGYCYKTDSSYYDSLSKVISGSN